MKIKKNLIILFATCSILVAFTSCKEKDLGKLDSSVKDEQCAVLHTNGLYLLKIDDAKISDKEKLAFWHVYDCFKVIKIPAGVHSVIFADVTEKGLGPTRFEELKLATDFEAGKEYKIESKTGLMKNTYSLVPYIK